MLDRLDEAGILFWSETLGPAVSLANTQDWSYFMRYQLVQMREMIGKGTLSRSGRGVEPTGTPHILRLQS